MAIERNKFPLKKLVKDVLLMSSVLLSLCLLSALVFGVSYVLVKKAETEFDDNYYRILLQSPQEIARAKALGKELFEDKGKTYIKKQFPDRDFSYILQEMRDIRGS